MNAVRKTRLFVRKSTSNEVAYCMQYIKNWKSITTIFKLIVETVGFEIFLRGYSSLEFWKNRFFFPYF